MKVYDYTNWQIVENREALMLFVQTMEESFFSHSHDSHKVSVSNFHTICQEVLNTITYIETDTIETGNLIPLLEEMETLFCIDPIGQEIFGSDFYSLFSRKNDAGEYKKEHFNFSSNKSIKELLPIIKKTVEYLKTEMDLKGQYYHKLLNAIKKYIENNDFSIDDYGALYLLTRLYASELVFEGFSQQYIYDCIEKCFYREKTVRNLESLSDFFDCFPSDKNEYVIYMPVNGFKQKKALDKLPLVEIEENVFEMFDDRTPYVLKFKQKAQDPFKLREIVVDCINFFLSVNQFFQHTKVFYDPKYSEVVNIKTKEVFPIKKPEEAMTRVRTRHYDIDPIDLLAASLDNSNVFQSVYLHSNALLSKNTYNKLISMWTAVEILVPTMKSIGMSKSNQICNALTTILGQDYFANLLYQLEEDLKLLYPEYRDDIHLTDSSDYSLDKILAIIVLPENRIVFDSLIKTLQQKAPLLAYRLCLYRDQWKTTEAISKTYKKHRIRLTQQIMRIYRARNLLVHDGTELLNTDYLLQNIHFYFDSCLDYFSRCQKKGYKDIQTMIEHAHSEERTYLAYLNRETTITKDNYINMILGVEYST